MKENSSSIWSSTHWWVKFYSYITISVVILGIAAAHIPAIIGHPWSSCDIGGLGCILTFHWFDVPMLVYNFYLALYGLYNFTPQKVSFYLLHLIVGISVNLVFFLFECELIMNSFNRGAPVWEIITLYCLSGMLIGGAFLGVYLAVKLLYYLKYKPSPFQNGTSLAPDGYYHPITEEDIITLVKRAHKLGLQIRCRGAAHSVGQSIYTDSGNDYPSVPNKVSEDLPPEGPNINIMLDQFKQLDWIDEKKGIVEAEAGIHLGPVLNVSTLEESFLWKIWEKGWALSDLGGITQQTISGFLMTGSAGGSLTYDLVDNLEAFRIIDGEGNVEWIDKTNAKFHAIGTSLGLMGIITKVRFKLIPRYLIKGDEDTTLTKLESCRIDLFGNGQGEKPSLESFIKNTPYTRVLWWPQKGVERIVTWTAKREAYNEHIIPKPYNELSDNSFTTILTELSGALLYTLLGNKKPIRAIWYIILDFDRFRMLLDLNWQKKMGAFLAGLFAFLLTFIFALILTLPIIFLSIFQFIPKLLLSFIIRLIQPLTSPKNPKKLFEDYYYRSLPMDNVADDVLLGTEFTEIWIPIQYTKKVMNLLNDHYKKEGYKATGSFSNELYGGYPSSFWMHPAYTNGNDEYKDGTLRVDLFWYTANDGAPNSRDGYYSQFWKLFKDAGIPFRLHWGKFVPDFDFQDWADYYKNNLPKAKDFLELREKRDPKNIFLTNYWQLRLYGTLD